MYVLINKKENCIDGISREETKLKDFFNKLEDKTIYTIVEIESKNYPVFFATGRDSDYKIMDEKEANEFVKNLKEAKGDIFGTEFNGFKLLKRRNVANTSDKKEQDEFESYQRYCILSMFLSDYFNDNDESYVRFHHISKLGLNEWFDGTAYSLFSI